MQAHALSRDELIKALTVYQGVTTANGNVGGTTLIDAGLIGVNDYITNKTILIVSEAAVNETKAASIFAAGTGTITVAAAFTAQILAGTSFKILTGDSATVIAILAGLAVPTANSAANILSRDVVGNKADNAVTVVGAVASTIAYMKGALNQIATALANMAVPAADAVTNALHRDVIGNKTSTAIYTPDAVSDSMRYHKGNMNTINMIVESPIPALSEVWQSELGMPEAYYEWTNPATGTPWIVQTSGAFREIYTAPAASENARLNGKRLYVIAPTTYGVTTIYKKVIAEFIVKLTGLANFDNTGFFIGLTSTKASTRATNNLIGLGLTGAGNALQTVTDAAGAETVNTGFGETLTNANKFRIEVYLSTVKFYMNEVLIATHVTNLPNVPMYRNIYLLNTAGGATGFELMGNRMWAETIAR